jgi:uncharacterized membrane protein YbhN (UPF0104 family)
LHPARFLAVGAIVIQESKGGGMTPDRQVARTAVQSGLSVTSDWLGAQWLFLVTVAISTILLAWIISRSSFAEIFAAVWSASIPLLLAAYALTVVGTLLTVSRWRLLLQALGAPLPFLRLLHSYLVATFFNNFLPSTVGGGASRAYDCYRMTGGNRRAMSSVVLDRLLGLLALVVFALGSLHFAKVASDHVPVLALWLSLAVIGLGGVVAAIFSACRAEGQRRPWRSYPGSCSGELRRLPALSNCTADDGRRSPRSFPSRCCSSSTSSFTLY